MDFAMAVASSLTRRSWQHHERLDGLRECRDHSVSDGLVLRDAFKQVLLGMLQISDVGDNVHPADDPTGDVSLRRERGAQPTAVLREGAGLRLP
jgi:hypothetical protein